MSLKECCETPVRTWKDCSCECHEIIEGYPAHALKVEGLSMHDILCLGKRRE